MFVTVCYYFFAVSYLLLAVFKIRAVTRSLALTVLLAAYVATPFYFTAYVVTVSIFRSGIGDTDCIMWWALLVIVAMEWVLPGVCVLEYTNERKGE
jgi:hypothetical protein